MPCVSMNDQDRELLSATIESNPEQFVSIDVNDLKVRSGELELSCELRPGARDSLLNGKWDPLDELLESKSEIKKVSDSLFYV